MDERCTVTLFVDLLEIYDQLGWVVLRVCEDLGAKKSDDVVADDTDIGFGLEVSIVYTEIRVEPVDLASDELAWNETLRREERQRR